MKKEAGLMPAFFVAQFFYTQNRFFKKNTISGSGFLEKIR